MIIEPKEIYSELLTKNKDALLNDIAFTYVDELEDVLFDWITNTLTPLVVFERCEVNKIREGEDKYEFNILIYNTNTPTSEVRIVVGAEYARIS